MRATLLVLAISGCLTAASPPGSYELALDRYNHTDYSGAVAGLRNQPPTAKSLELLGRSYLMLSDYKKAVETLEKAVSLDPQNSMTWTWLGRAHGRRAETSFAVGAIGHATKAREAFEKAVQLDPKNGDAINDLFDYYVQAPGFMGGGFDKARNLIPMIGEIDPAQAHYARARLAEEKKDFTTAEAQFRRALHLAPNEIGRILELSSFLTKHGKGDEGDQLFERARQISPKSPKLLFARAEMWIQSKKNVDQARELLKQYLASKDLTPDDPPKPDALKLLKKTDGM